MIKERQLAYLKSINIHATPQGIILMKYCCCCLIAISCPSFYDPIDCSLPGPSVEGISYVRTLEWVSISFSMGSSRPTSPVLASRFFITEPASSRKYS